MLTPLQHNVLLNLANEQIRRPALGWIETMHWLLQHDYVRFSRVASIDNSGFAPTAKGREYLAKIKASLLEEPCSPASN